MNEERALIARASRGESAALDRLAALHRPTVLRTATHLLGDAETAEDVTQDVLIRLQVALPGFRGDAELSTWLYRVTLNRCRDLMRKRQTESLEAPAGQAAVKRLGVERDPGDAVDAERRRRAVREAIDRLPQEQREVVVLRYLSDLSYAEIAELTEIPQGTVASRVFRGLKKIGEDLEFRHLELVK